MEDTKPQVEVRGYIGGQEGIFGGFCHPVIIRVDGQEHYVLHEMHTYADAADGDTVKAEHNKVEFDTLDELLASFTEVERKLGIDRSLNWEKTDASCGYEVPPIQTDMGYNLR